MFVKWAHWHPQLAFGHFIVANGGATSDVMHSFRNRSEFALALVRGGMGGATWQPTTRPNRERPATSVSPPAASGLTPFCAADSFRISCFCTLVISVALLVFNLFFSNCFFL